MPRPDDELLAKICQEWDAFKAGLAQTSTEAAAREWLIQHTPVPPGVTLAHLLAGAFEPAISEPGEARKLAAGDTATLPIGSLGTAIEGVVQSEGNVGAVFPGDAIWPIGTLAKIIEGLIRSQGSTSAAAEEVSRLAQLLAGEGNLWPGIVQHHR